MKHKMTKRMICGEAFEELSNEELYEYEGGAATTFLSTTTVGCLAASIIISGGVSLVITCFSKK